MTESFHKYIPKCIKSTKIKHPQQKQPYIKKYKWKDPETGYSLSAGGILFYDETGIWVIGEKNKDGITYTDIGGKYTYEDGNIWATISRELREETYGICEMFTSEIVSLSKKYKPMYIHGHDSNPVYACLIIPTSALDLSSRKNFSLDPDLYNIKRHKTISENPDVPLEFYCPCILAKLSYDDIRSNIFKLSYRLKRILQYSKIL